MVLRWPRKSHQTPEKLKLDQCKSHSEDTNCARRACPTPEVEKAKSKRQMWSNSSKSSHSFSKIELSSNGRRDSITSSKSSKSENSSKSNNSKFEDYPSPPKPIPVFLSSTCPEDQMMNSYRNVTEKMKTTPKQEFSKQHSDEIPSSKRKRRLKNIGKSASTPTKMSHNSAIDSSTISSSSSSTSSVTNSSASSKYYSPSDNVIEKKKSKRRFKSETSASYKSTEIPAAENDKLCGGEDNAGSFYQTIAKALNSYGPNDAHASPNDSHYQCDVSSGMDDVAVYNNQSDRRMSIFVGRVDNTDKGGSLHEDDVKWECMDDYASE